MKLVICEVLIECFYFQIFSPFGFIEDVFIVRDEFKQSRGIYLAISLALSSKFIMYCMRLEKYLVVRHILLPVFLLIFFIVCSLYVRWKWLFELVGKKSVWNDLAFIPCLPLAMFAVSECIATGWLVDGCLIISPHVNFLLLSRMCICPIFL